MSLTPAQIIALRRGGLIYFAGGTNVLKAGWGAALSFLIGRLTKSKQAISHIAVLPPVDFWPSANEPWIIESTEWKGVSGPQWNQLESRLQLDYAVKGGHAWFRGFLPQFAPNWSGAWLTAQQLFSAVHAGKLHYSVARLFGDAVDRDWLFAALPIAGIIDHLSEHDHGVVCSECAGLVLQGGQIDAKVKAARLPYLPNVEPIAGQVIGCSPEDWWEMPIQTDPLELL